MENFAHLGTEDGSVDTSKPSTSAPKPKSSYIDLNIESRNSTFAETFGKLKDSEFYEDIPCAGSGSKSDAADSRIKPGSASRSSIIVNPRQRGNPILKSIRNVPWEYGDVIPDYVMGQTTCALFLSLRYHLLKPEYIHDRLQELGRQYSLRVLLVQVDVKDPHHCLKQLTKICLLTDLTLMLAWSPEDAGQIIETYKIFEHKPPDLIMEKQESNPLSKVVDALSSVKSVNRTDAMTLLSNFGSLEGIIKLSQEDISLCPGLGPQKAARLYQVLHEPFKRLKK